MSSEWEDGGRGPCGLARRHGRGVQGLWSGNPRGVLAEAGETPTEGRSWQRSTR
jgi:hypothetical protein